VRRDALLAYAHADINSPMNSTVPPIENLYVNQRVQRAARDIPRLLVLEKKTAAPREAAVFAKTLKERGAAQALFARRRPIPTAPRSATPKRAVVGSGTAEVTEVTDTALMFGAGKPVAA